jgi:hypothetical protein
VLRLVGVVLAGGVMLLAADCVAGLWYRTGTVAQLHVSGPRSGVAREGLVVFPGFSMSGAALSRAFSADLPDDEAMVVVEYAERGVDVTRIYRRVMAELDRLRPQSLRVYGGSMGGMCARDFLAHYERDGKPFGAVVLVLDTSPSGSADVKLPHVLFDLASRYPGGPLSSAVWAAVSKLRSHPPHEVHADPETIKQARHAGAWAAVPALTSQAAYIDRFAPLGPDELTSVADRTVYLRGHSPGTDPLIDVDQAVRGWRRAFPALKVVTLTHRAERWHLPLIEWPHETMRAILTA